MSIDSIQSIVQCTYLEFQSPLKCYNLPRHGASCNNYRGTL